MISLPNNRCDDPHRADGGCCHPTVDDTLGVRSIRGADG